jgi:hypothetical protein
MTEFRMEPSTLPQSLAQQALTLARQAATWNRNKCAERTVLMVTDQQAVARALGINTSRCARSAGLTWMNWKQKGQSVIWLRPGRYPTNTMRTMLHEAVHAMAGSSTQHDVSFRRLFSLTMVAYNHWCMKEMQEGLSTVPWYKPQDEMLEIVERYTQRWGGGYVPRRGSSMHLGGYSDSWYDMEWKEAESSCDYEERMAQEAAKHEGACIKFRAWLSTQ